MTLECLRKLKESVFNKSSDSKMANMKQSIKSKAPKRLISAALDIGTTYSGYAYSVSNEPKEIFVNQNWVAGARALISLKTPTCVLLKPNKEFHSFGYDAENNYLALADDDDHQDWFYFWRFKMVLHQDRDITKKTPIEDSTGKQMPALTIFSLAIKYLKDHLMKTLQNRVNDVTSEDVTFVLTVPAIWNERAKQFIRDAAVMAGIENDQLIIALEPEVASIWCQSMRNPRNEVPDDTKMETSSPGSQYMVVDIGGGTADITVHRKQADSSLKEIHKATGGPWGGTEVDKAFLKLLADIVTKDVMDKFTSHEVSDLIDLLREFEVKKRTISTSTDGNVVVKIPASLKEKYEESGHTLSEIKERYEGSIEWKGDKMKISAELIKRTFDHPVNNLIAHVYDLMQERQMADVEKIILVGGCAESPIVWESFKEFFGNKTVIIPADCGLAVLKGAVVFGHNPAIVTCRIARYTYGIETAVPFDPAIHPLHKRCETINGPLCRNAFWKAIEVGTPLPVGLEISRVGKPAFDYQSYVNYGIYRSININPILVSESGCEKIGEICVRTDPTKTSTENTLEEIFSFGDTEIKFFTRHHLSGDEQELYLHI